MKEKLIELLKLDAKATDEQIVAAVGTLNERVGNLVGMLDEADKQIAELSAAPKTIKIDPRIREKMAAGLNFQQATEVVAAQEAEDKAAKKAAK
jgi:hypothetical protein